MALWYVPERGIVDDSDEDVHIPEYGEMRMPSGEVIHWGVEGTRQLPQYTNVAQYGQDSYQWDPQHYGQGQGPSGSYAVGYIPQLIDWSDAAETGTLQPYELEQYQQMVQQARAIPMRDVSQLQAGYPGEEGDLSGYLTPASPDAGAIMLTLRDRIQSGQATGQEQALYRDFLAQMREQDYRATVPQASDAFNPLGDQFFGALGTIALGATAGLAAAPLAAGGAGLATTLGSIGTLAGVAGTGAGVIGGAIDQPWLQQLGLGLSAAGGLAGGVGGLANLWSTGVSSLGDAARLASSAGRVTGALGRIPGADPLRQAGSYLGLAGGLGQGASGVQGLLGAAQGVTEGAAQGGAMDYDYSWDYGGEAPYDNWSWDAGGGGGGGAMDYDYSWDYGGEAPYDNWSSEQGGGGGGEGGSSFLSTLGGLARTLGPLISGAGSVASGAMGAQASQSAAGAQTAALNRGLDLQTAQWLQSQANQAPWLQAGQQALPQLQQLAADGPPAPFQPGATISGANYAMPSATPGWTPQLFQWPGASVSAEGYQYRPGQGPQAQDYRYTPGSVPGAANYRYTPGAVPTLSGQALLANDPGYRFRQDEARRALEASAAYRGAGMSGSTLGALQRQSSELASQEYGQAFARASEQAQLREGWAQQASQIGFGQALSEAQLREQVQQLASSQGWSQAQAEAALREQTQQTASQQNWQQALQGNQNAYTQMLEAQQFNQQNLQNYHTQLYENQMQQNQLTYGRDLVQNQSDYERALQAYNSQTQSQQTQWNRLAGLAGIGQTASQQLATGGQANAQQQASTLAQLGQAQAQGTLGSARSWQQGLQGATNNATGWLAGVNR